EARKALAEAERQRQRAEEQQAEAERQQRRAEEQKTEAERQQQRAKERQAEAEQQRQVAGNRRGLAGALRGRADQRAEDYRRLLYTSNMSLSMQNREFLASTRDRRDRLNAILVGGLYGSRSSSRVRLPEGWYSTTLGYEAWVDREISHSGKACGSIKSTGSSTKSGFGTLIQSIRADDYRGMRVRLSGYVKTEKVDRASLWMRVDGETGEPMSFDNMDDRRIEGITDWKKYEIVLEVPENSIA